MDCAVKINVYIDGFNVYYGCCRKTGCRWLDLGKLCHLTLSPDEVVRIRYFTAHVHSTDDDPGKAQRQQTYLRALRTIPTLTIHTGSFLTHRVRRRLVEPLGGHRWAWVWKTEEKGSDVNLASYLLIDAFERNCDAAVVISNNSDLVAPIELVTKRLGHKVGVLNPHLDGNNSRELANVANLFHRRLTLKTVRASLFPDVLTDARGEIRKPQGW